MAISGAHPRGKLEDTELARLAVGGDGHAFAELYDRNERRVYGFCMRMLAAPHDAADATQETFVRMLTRLPALQGRDLDFLAYTLATARNVCYDMIRSRRTVAPTEEELPAPGPVELDIEVDPERFVLLSATREDVRAANVALPPRQREVLALREVELLSYDEIGELMDLNRNAVAQLISRARIKLAELLRGSALASVGPSSPDCERALPLLASIQDEQQAAPGELDWIRAHLSGCDTCRLSRAAMEEAGTSYRALALLVPALWLRRATIARAAEAVGADWSEVADSALHPTLSDARQAVGGRGRFAAAALLGLALCAVLALLLAGSIGRDGTARLAPVASNSLTPATTATASVPANSDRLTASHGAVSTARLTGSSSHTVTPGAVAVPTAPVRHSLALRKPAHRSKHRRRRRPAPVRRAPTGNAPAPVVAPAPAPVPPAATTTVTQTTPLPTPAPTGSSGSTTSTTGSPAGGPGSEGSTTTPTTPNGPPGLIP
jgi:RNA polymerase sigma-70 factor, ECF subfamily